MLSYDKTEFSDLSLSSTNTHSLNFALSTWRAKILTQLRTIKQSLNVDPSLRVQPIVSVSSLSPLLPMKRIASDT